MSGVRAIAYGFESREIQMMVASKVEINRLMSPQALEATSTKEAIRQSQFAVSR